MASFSGLLPCVPWIAHRHNLKGNLDLLSHRAEVQYYNHDFRAAVATCRDILQRDPYHLTCLPVYLCTLHELQQKNELFYRELPPLCSEVLRYHW